MNDATGIWNLSIVSDPGCLSGKSVKAFFEALVNETEFKWVFVKDVIGAFSGLQKMEQTLKWKEFIKLVEDAVQYDWGFMFLFEKEPLLDVSTLSDRELIVRSRATVRLVDDTYFYTYTQDQEISNGLLRRFPGSHFQSEPLTELPIPY
jgi:hypothetical protein